MAETPSYVTYTGDGTTTDFVIPFDYLAEAHVQASVDGVSTSAFSFFAADTIRFDAAPSSGVAIRIERVTPAEPLVVFTPSGGALLETHLNTATTQARMIAEEASEVANEALGAAGSASAAAASEAAAAASETAAAASAAAAATSETNAAASAAAAQAAVGAVPLENVTGLQAALDGKSATGHGHVISDVTNLQASLDAKADDSAMTAALAGKQAASANLDGWSVLAPSAKQDAMTLATQAQAEAGTDDATWMSPLKTAQAITALAASGSWTLINETIISGTPSYIDFAGTWDYPILEVEYVGVGGSFTARERLWLSDDDGTSWASFSTTGIAGNDVGITPATLSDNGAAGTGYYSDVTGTVRIFRANETVIKPIIIGPIHYDDPWWAFGRANTSASLGPINRIRCSRYNQAGSRTYSRGTIRLWGIK